MATFIRLIRQRGHFRNTYRQLHNLYKNIGPVLNLCLACMFLCLTYISVHKIFNWTFQTPSQWKQRHRKSENAVVFNNIGAPEVDPKRHSSDSETSIRYLNTKVLFQQCAIPRQSNKHSQIVTLIYKSINFCSSVKQNIHALWIILNMKNNVLVIFSSRTVFPQYLIAGQNAINQDDVHVHTRSKKWK